MCYICDGKGGTNKTPGRRLFRHIFRREKEPHRWFHLYNDGWEMVVAVVVERCRKSPGVQILFIPDLAWDKSFKLGGGGHGWWTVVHLCVLMITERWAYGKGTWKSSLHCKAGHICRSLLEMKDQLVWHLAAACYELLVNGKAVKF